MTIRTATVVGAALWLYRHVETPPRGPGRDRLCNQVERLIAAQNTLAKTLDRRLRSLEESTARSEAELRFMATLLGDGGPPPPAGTVPNSRALVPGHGPTAASPRCGTTSSPRSMDGNTTRPNTALGASGLPTTEPSEIDGDER